MHRYVTRLRGTVLGTVARVPSRRIAAVLLVGAEEALEDFALILRRNAAAGILDHQQSRAGFGAERHPHPPALGRVAERVGQQVARHAGEQRRVALDRGGLVEGSRQRDARGGGLGLILVDDLGDWRGIGTALFLQDAGCQVTLLTSAAAVASGLFHSAADIPTRRRFALGGGKAATHAVLSSWADGAALIRSTLTDEERTETFDWLVVAETPTPRSELSAALESAGVRHHRIGDCVAARRASLAIYEGRRLGLSL